MSARAIALVWLAAALVVVPGLSRAGMKVDLDEELLRLLRGEQPNAHIAGARFRVAVFTYEDPDRTGLGNLLAGVVAHEVLLNSRLGSLGVLRYEGNLAPSPGVPGLSYFDKVDRVTEAQHVSLSVWGSIRRLSDRLLVETYLQLPPDSLRRFFTWRLPVRAADSVPGGVAGGAPPVSCGTLSAQLRPERVAVQVLEVPFAEQGHLSRFSFDLLRKEPESRARPVGRLRKGDTYEVLKREGDWAQVYMHGVLGWIPVRPACGPACDQLAKSGAFVRHLLEFMHGRELPSLGSSTLHAEALAVAEQLTALEGLAGGSARLEQTTLELAGRWDGPARLTGLDAATGIDRGSGPPPGGAAFANIRAMGRVALALEVAAEEVGKASAGLDREARLAMAAVPRTELLTIAFDLADALQQDPRSADALRNLVILFRCAGDEQRARLAEQLAGK